MIRVNAHQAAKLIGERPRSKYGARRTEYQGVVYDSKREAEFAAELDLLVKAGEIIRWQRQWPITLHAADWITNGRKRLGVYNVDFRIENRDGTFRYVEVKGVWTALAKWKVAHAEREYGIKIEIVK